MYISIKFNFQPDFNSLTLQSTGFGHLVPYKFPSVFVCCRYSARLLKKEKKENYKRSSILKTETQHKPQEGKLSEKSFFFA